MEEIRLGTIGSGLIVRTILDNVARTDGIRLVAVYSRREDTGRWRARLPIYSIPHMQAGDYGGIDTRLDVMLSVVETIETSRKQAGLLFPGD